MMRWYDVPSHIKRIGYDPDLKELRAEFPGGAIYSYADVPNQVVSCVLFPMGETKIGSAFDAHIKKGGFVSRKIEPELAQPAPGDRIFGKGTTYEYCDICKGEQRFNDGICVLCQTEKPQEVEVSGSGKDAPSSGPSDHLLPRGEEREVSPR
jgi:hypothetical protein